MDHSRINVAVRTRPCGWGSTSAVHMDVLEKEVSVQLDQHTHRFRFEKLIHGVSQQEVFQELGIDAIEAALSGVNATIIAYGQTGAGKTHTLAGSRNSYQERGIIPRALSYLFSDAAQGKATVRAVSLRYVEIYNESMVDLLSTSTTPTSVTLIETKDHVIPHGATEQVLQNEQHALETFFQGEACRVTREHALNKDSSRSHAVCMLQLSLQTDSDGPQVVKSLLTLVDLAGSERVHKTRSEGIVLREAGYINKSLTFLEQVAIAISEGRQHVPYRSAKLTHLLKHAIGGNSKTTLIANIWDDAEQRYETLSTLRFAQRMSKIETAIAAYKTPDHEATIAQLLEQIETLRAALGDQYATRTPGHPEQPPVLDPGEHVCDQVLNVLQARNEDEVQEALIHIDLMSACGARAALCAARLLYQRCVAAHGPMHSSVQGPADGIASSGHSSHNITGSCGQSCLPQHDKAADDTGEFGDALRHFKTHVAVGVDKLMQARAEEVASTRKRVKDLALRINAEKQNIDQLRSFTQSGSEALEHSKAVYRALYQELEQEKQELNHSSESLKNLKGEFQDRFHAWYQEQYMASNDGPGLQMNAADTTVLATECSLDTQTACIGPVGLGHPHSSPKQRRPSDYNNESRSFYDAQRRMEVTTGHGSTKCKFNHLGHAWRISG